MKRAVGYVRVSAVMGREGDSFMSPDLQREKIEAWAAYRDYTIVGYYVDLDVSGRRGTKRPEFERMMSDARDGKFEAVAVYRLTRFSRSVSEASARYEELEKLGVDLASVTEDIDTSTAGGKFMRNMLSALAEFESERIGEEWRNIHATRRRRGIAHAATPVLGYRIANAEVVGVEPAEVPAIRKLFQLRVAGHGYGAIASALEREGFTSKRGRPRIPIPSVRYMLRNPLYAGLVRLEDGELIDATHQAIVSRELWEQAQRVGARTNRLSRHRASLLSGLVVCSGCGYRMDHDRDRNGPIYRCSARTRSSPCPRSVTIRAEWADDHVEAAFLRRVDRKRMPHGGKLKQTQQQSAWRRKASTAGQRVAEMNRALDELADQRYVKGTLTAEEYDRQSQRFLDQRVAAQKEADDLEELAATVTPIEQDVLASWSLLSMEAKRRALRLAVGWIEVLPTPRKGPGQRAFVAQRLEIGWIR